MSKLLFILLFMISYVKTISYKLCYRNHNSPSAATSNSINLKFSNNILGFPLLECTINTININEEKCCNANIVGVNQTSSLISFGVYMYGGSGGTNLRSIKMIIVNDDLTENSFFIEKFYPSDYAFATNFQLDVNNINNPTSYIWVSIPNFTDKFTLKATKWGSTGVVNFQEDLWP